MPLGTFLGGAGDVRAQNMNAETASRQVYLNAINYQQKLQAEQLQGFQTSYDNMVKNSVDTITKALSEAQKGDDNSFKNAQAAIGQLIQYTTDVGKQLVQHGIIDGNKLQQVQGILQTASNVPPPSVVNAQAATQAGAVAGAQDAAKTPQDTALISELKSAGIMPGTPEYKKAILDSVTRPNMVYTVDPNNPNALIPIPGGPADPNTKPLTDEQAKVGGFADRAHIASSVVDQLAGKYSPWAINAKIAADNFPVIGGSVAGPLANLALTPEDQQVEQAQRDFINAILRRESGAVISPSEFDNARKQYFPQPGDKPEVIKQKAKNRETAINALARAAGSKYKLPETPKIDAKEGSIPEGVDPDLWKFMTDDEKALWTSSSKKP